MKLDTLRHLDANIRAQMVAGAVRSRVICSNPMLRKHTGVYPCTCDGRFDRHLELDTCTRCYTIHIDDSKTCALRPEIILQVPSAAYSYFVHGDGIDRPLPITCIYPYSARKVVERHMATLDTFWLCEEL